MSDWFSNGQGDFFEENSSIGKQNTKKTYVPVYEKEKQKKDNDRLKIFAFQKEYVFFIMILFIVMLLGTFFIGIERGKMIAKQQPIARYKAVVNQQQKVFAKNVVKKKTLENKEIINEILENTTVVKASSDEKENTKDVEFVEKNDELPYAIQVVTYARADLAEKEVRSLRKKGFASFSMKSGKYHIICVGPFKTKEKAKYAKRKLLSSYKDCFLKKIK